MDVTTNPVEQQAIMLRGGSSHFDKRCNGNLRCLLPFISIFAQPYINWVVYQIGNCSPLPSPIFSSHPQPITQHGHNLFTATQITRNGKIITALEHLPETALNELARKVNSYSD